MDDLAQQIRSLVDHRAGQVDETSAGDVSDSVTVLVDSADLRPKSTEKGPRSKGWGFAISAAAMLLVVVGFVGWSLANSRSSAKLNETSVALPTAERGSEPSELDPTEPGVASSHPALDCVGEPSGVGNYDLVGPGFATAAAALESRLEYYRGLYGGEIVDMPGDEAALEVGGANVVVARATAVAEGGYVVSEDYACAGFGPQQQGTPDTEPDR